MTTARNHLRTWAKAGLAGVAGAALTFAGPPVRATEAPAPSPPTVEEWGVFEVALRGPSTGNPFVDVNLTARFTQGRSVVRVTGFYDGDGVYRIRFMPETTGLWRYVTASNCALLAGHAGEVTVGPPSPGDHGPVRVAHTYHFAYADGTPYFELGTTCYAWIHRSDAQQEETLRTLAASPFNKIRMCVFPQDNRVYAPRLFPYVGTPPRHWDTTRFNPAFFRNLEERVGQLRDLGIQADLILFHPYGGTWGFSNLDAASDDRYVRYLVARLAAYRNVWWSLANEYDFIRTKHESDWDRLFQIVWHSDPYGHLRSIHNGARIYNDTLPWVTHASIQNGAAVEDPERAVLYRDVYRKPVVFDEVKYEGDIAARWGQLSAQELVFRFWNGTVAGTYVGHSEIFRATPDPWLAGGGTLRGQSVPRLAFLRTIVDAAPAAGLDPIDKWQDERTAGQPGQYYLIYFGKCTPHRWSFSLYKAGLKDGMRFRADILDTWNMTVTPVPGVFTIKRQNAYRFADADGRSIALPDRPYIALRLRRADPPHS